MISKGCDVSEFFPDVVKNVASPNIEIRKLVYIYLLRYSGLRISDATSLRKDRVTEDGRLFLHMQHKTRVPVYVPLPPVVVRALRAVADMFPDREYFFWTGTGRSTSPVSTGVRRAQRSGATTQLPDSMCEANAGTDR